MATSGYKDITITNNHYIRFSWSLKSQSVANNTSTVNWNMKLIADEYGYMQSSTAKTWKVVVNGKTYSGTVNITHNPGDTLTLASGSTTIAHNADGTKTFSYSFTQQIAITYAGTRIETFSGSGSGTLTTIPRVSTVKATNNYIESNSTITITRGSSDFKHTLQYKISGADDSTYKTIVSKTTSTSYSWKIPTAIYSSLGSAEKTKKITIRCITYSGSTNIGNKTCEITATCKESLCRPEFYDMIAYDTGTVSIKLVGNPYTQVIKDYNSFYVALSVIPKYGAKIVSYTISNGDKSVSKTGTDLGDFFEGRLSYVKTAKFTFTAKDSRGFSYTESLTYELINYIQLTASLNAKCYLNPDNNTASLEFNVSGNWYGGNFGYNETNSTVDNDLWLRYQLKKDGVIQESGETNPYNANDTDAKNWHTIVATVDRKNNKYSYSSILTNLDYTATYTIQIKAWDACPMNGGAAGIATSNALTVSAKPIFDWGENDFNFNVPIKINVNQASGDAWYSTENKTGGGLNLANSDIVGANTIYFGDKCNAAGEGFGFPNGNTDSFDYVKAYDGNLIIVPNHPTNTTAYGLAYTPGNKISFTDNTPIHGYLTNGRCSIFLSFPINKPLVGVSGATFSGKIQMRGSNGYLYNQASNKTEKSTVVDLANTTTVNNAEGIEGYTVSLSGSFVRLTLTFKVALTANAAGTTASLNNTPVCIVPNGTLTITFK